MNWVIILDFITTVSPLMLNEMITLVYLKPSSVLNGKFYEMFLRNQHSRQAHCLCLRKTSQSFGKSNNVRFIFRKFLVAKVYSEPFQTSRMELFGKMVNGCFLIKFFLKYFTQN